MTFFYNVQDAIDELYTKANYNINNPNIYHNFVINDTREVSNIISLTNLEKGEYICSSYYSASSYESNSTRGTSSSISYTVTGCDSTNYYNNYGHWNAANTEVSTSIYTSTMTRDINFYCKINNNNTSLSIDYSPKTRTDKCSVSLQLLCVKVK